MRVGDLVNVAQDRGSGSFKRTDHLGLGIILSVHKTDDLVIGTVGPVNLGDSFTVRLLSGETREFSGQSLEVVSESRQLN